MHAHVRIRMYARIIAQACPGPKNKTPEDGHFQHHAGPLHCMHITAYAHV
jgi:hypothetical protein